jgi:Flp pilus assembly protein TadB
MNGVSKEYEEFLRSGLLKKTFYERLCEFAQKTLPIKPPKSVSEKFSEAIKFAHLKVTPQGAFSLAVLLTLAVLIIPMTAAVIFGFLSASVVLLTLIFTFFTFYYLFDYPKHAATVFRIRASAEMILAIIYMTISMRISANIENAVKFAAKNLSGPLGVDLRALLWDVYTRKFTSMSDALDYFITKWKKDNEEFTEALYLIKTSSTESAERMEKALDEAVEVILTRTKERMKRYAQDLRTPVTVVNAMGILLPILALIFLPIMTIFLPQAIQPSLLFIGYDFLLPVSVGWMLKSYLEKRPYTFHQPDISKHPKFREFKKFGKLFWISVAIAVASSTFALFNILSAQQQFDFIFVVYSLAISWGIGGAIIFYSFVSAYGRNKIRAEVAAIESEFAEALFQLGNQLSRGIPIEKALRTITPRIRNLKISKFFEIALYNMESLGMTFEQAVFDSERGAINYYPSKMIEAIFHALSEISRRGMEVVSRAMLTISGYLKDVHQVEEDLREMLGETTSSMTLQGLLLAPLTAGIVVALTALVAQILHALKISLDKIYGGLTGLGPLSAAGTGLLNSVLSIDKLIPAHVFQIVVGVYLIEVVGTIAVSLSLINNGDENILKRLTLAKYLLLSLVVYTLTLLATYYLFISLVPVEVLLG